MESRTHKQPPKDGQSRRSTTPPSDSMSDFTDSASSVSSRNASRDPSRANTPRPLPKFQYDKEELVKLRDRPLSKKRPKCLSPENDNPDGYWDPDIWIRSFDTNSRGSSPLTASGQPRERKRPAELERETIFKRKSSVSSDPKGRILEEEEDGLGIVLSPQRRSFGTGCHVSVMPQRRPPSPTDDRDRDNQANRDHRKGSKIGSGRIQINHERHEREYRDQRARYERDDHRPFDRPNPLDRFRREDPRDRREERRDERDRRDERRDDRRDERRDSARDRREDGMMRERFRRDFGNDRDRDRYENGRMRRDYRRHEAEPEWFTEGPSSQSETIELHGFEGPPSSREASEEPEKSSKHSERGGRRDQSEREKSKTTKAEKKTAEDKSEKDAKKIKIDEKLRDENKEKEEDQPRSRAGSMTVADRNGSVETNESSSPENSPHHAEDRPPRAPSGDGIAPPPGIVVPGQSTSGQDFDFNEFFKIDNIPGLTDAVQVEQEHTAASGSRFSQWFQISSGSHPNSRNDSRRSSINEEFGYLNDLLNLSGGQKSPVIPSPPLIDPHARFGIPRGPHFVPSGEPQQQQQQQQNLMEMLKKASAAGAQGSRAEHLPQEALRKDRPPLPGQALAASELEANLKALLMGSTDSGIAGVRVSAEPKVFSPPQGALMPVSAKVTTVSELEAGLKQLGLNKDAQAAAAITAANKQLAMEYLLKQKKDQRQKSDINPAGDMGAYNKLLMMMKSSGVLHDTPKMPKLAQQQQQAKLLQQQQQQQTKIQQQQVKQIQQQHQQKQVQDQILKFMKQNPGLMPKSGTNSSPISPSLNTLQPPPSPRCPSPAIPQQALLQPQQSPSPRAPSPIMFGSQPPMHLTAPSPIHPTQMPQNSQTLSPNTLQVGQGNNVRRVPSPQELIVHTQAIMQNALIKKQLEDQKERFLKKQQGRSKSPNPLGNGMPIAAVTLAPSTGSSSPVVLAKPSPAFTPTSVIRKMVNDKAEKQVDGEIFDQASPEKKPPILKIIHMDSSEELGKVEEDRSQPLQIPKVDTPPIMTVASDGSINIPVPVTPKTPNKSEAQNNATPTTPGKSPRALFGQGTMNTLGQMVGAVTSVQQPGVPSPQQAAAVAAAIQQAGVNGGRPIVKGINQTPGQQPPHLAQPQAQRPIISGGTPGLTSPAQPQKVDILSQSQQQRPIVGTQNPGTSPQATQQTPPGAPAQGRPPPSPSMPRASANQFPITGRMPMVRAGSVGISPPTTTNQLLMQRMVQAGSVANTGRGFQQMGVNQLSPISALQAAQAQAQAAQAQQRTMDPRLQAGRNVYPMGNSGNIMGANTSPRGGFQMSNLNRALSPQSQMAPVSLGKPDGMSVSPSLMSHQAMNTNLGALFHGGVEGNLAKWFGNDVLKHQGPAMPPLPSQGQKVMTVDEIERRQQMVTN